MGNALSTSSQRSQHALIEAGIKTVMLIVGIYLSLYAGLTAGEDKVCRNTCSDLDYEYYRVLNDNSCDCFDAETRIAPQEEVDEH